MSPRQLYMFAIVSFPDPPHGKEGSGHVEIGELMGRGMRLRLLVKQTSLYIMLKIIITRLL